MCTAPQTSFFEEVGSVYAAHLEGVGRVCVHCRLHIVCTCACTYGQKIATNNRDDNRMAE